MKVISEVKEITCSSCKTKLEYEPKDIQIQTTFIINQPYVCCPICGHKIFIQ